MDSKRWMQALPSVDLARPRSCPACGVASCPVGAPLRLVGHGVIERSFTGPTAPGQPPVGLVVRLRRYRCRTCRAVVVVAPRGVLRRRRYHGPALGLGLLLIAAGVSAVDIRARLCPDRHLGLASRDRWRTLARWCEAARQGALWSTLGPVVGARERRAVAARVALALEGRGRLGLDDDRADAVWRGALAS